MPTDPDREFLVAIHNAMVDLLSTLLDHPGDERAMRGIKAELHLACERFENHLARKGEH